MNVLLTGASGFVGAHVARELKSRGHRVIALVRGSSLHAPLSAMGVELAFGSLDDPGMRAVKLPAVDGVLHVGGTIKAKSAAQFYRTNAEGTRHLLENPVMGGVRSFVFVSSVSARGPEGPAGDNPVSHYGKSKLEAERILLESPHRFAKVIIRPPIVYGEGDRETFTLFKMFKAGYFPMLTGGERRMSFIYVKDLAAILANALENPSATPGPFYPEDGHRGYDWDQILAIAGQLYGHRIRKLPVPQWVVALSARINELAGRALDRLPMFTWDKYQEMKQRSWACDPAACHQAFPLPNYVDLATGFSIANRWYRDQRWY